MLIHYCSVFPRWGKFLSQFHIFWFTQLMKHMQAYIPASIYLCGTPLSKKQGWRGWGANWESSTDIYTLRLVCQSHSSLCEPMECNLPGSSVHGISQARISEQIAISFSRGSSQPKDWTHGSFDCIGRWILLPLLHLGNPIYITMCKIDS